MRFSFWGVILALSAFSQMLRADLSVPTRPSSLPLQAPSTGGIVIAWGDNTYSQATPPLGLCNVVQVAAGDRHSVALKSDGTVAVWGNNSWGQTNAPAGLTNVVQVAAGGEYTVALKSDGTLVAWGQMANGLPASAPTAPIGSFFSGVAAGLSHGCAIVRDGWLYGWGTNKSSQIPPASNPANYVQVAAGYSHTVALTAGGTISAWGDNTYGQTSVSGNSGFVQVAAGAYHTVALHKNGTVFSWGAVNQAATPAGLTNVVQVAAGLGYTIALKSDGTLLEWGNSNSFSGLTGITQVAAGVSHALAIQPPNPKNLVISASTPGIYTNKAVGYKIQVGDSPIKITSLGIYYQSDVVYYFGTPYSFINNNAYFIVGIWDANGNLINETYVSGKAASTDGYGWSDVDITLNPNSIYTVASYNPFQRNNTGTSYQQTVSSYCSGYNTNGITILNPVQGEIQGSADGYGQVHTTVMPASPTYNNQYYFGPNIKYYQTNPKPTPTPTPKTAQTISFPSIPLKTYGNAPFTLAATASSGLPVSYYSPSTNISSSIVSISSNTVTILGAGTATIWASQAGNSNYAAASNVSQILMVAKAPASVVLSGLSQTYSGSGRQVTISTTPTNLAVTTTYNGATNAPTDAGTYAVVSTVVNPNYSGTMSGSLVIAKAGNLITFSPLASKTFGQAPYLLTNASASSGLPITYSSSAPSVATISNNTLTILGAGTATITASQAGNSNYVTASSVTKTLTIAKAAQTVSFHPTTPVTFVKNGTFSLSASNTSGSPVTFTSGNTSILTISGKTATMKAKGTVNVTATAAATTNYNAAATNATITLQ